MIIPNNTTVTRKITHRQHALLMVERRLLAIRDNSTDDDMKMLLQQLLVMNEVLFNADNQVTTWAEKYEANYDYPATM